VPINSTQPEDKLDFLSLLQCAAIRDAAAAEFQRLCALTPKTFMDEIPRRRHHLMVQCLAKNLTEKWPEAIRSLAEAANAVIGGDYLCALELPAAVYFAGGRFLRLIVMWVPPAVDEDGNDVPSYWAGRFDVVVLSRAD